MKSRPIGFSRPAGGAARPLRLVMAVLAATLLWFGVAAPAAPASPGPSPMIIGGSDATEPYSFMASIQNAGGHFCGGSLITGDWVVTARHCVEGKNPADLQLRIGSLRKDQGGTVRGVERLVTHPESDTATHDIALVRLDQPVTGAPVPVDVRQPAGTPTRLLGWGCTEPGQTCGEESTPTVLQQLDSAVRELSACTNEVTPLDPASEVCTGNPETRAGACFGDSGGPLLRREGTGWKLIGAFSRVEIKPPDPGQPSEPPNCRSGMGIYTDVPAHQEWIDGVIASTS
ncbi:S1 family peptidase [Actinomadura litoris]|nr:serine protease [Actinomadura litoris]